MMDLVIPAIIIVVVLLLASFFYRRNVLNRLKDADHKKDQILEMPVGDEIEATAKIKLNGDVLEEFNSYSDIYKNISEKEIPEIQQKLVEAENLLNSFKLWSANDVLDDVFQSLSLVEGHLNDIRDGLVKFQNVDNQNHEAIESVDNTIREINQHLLSQNYAFGPSSEKLEDRLHDIKSSYDQFVDDTSNGDQGAAKELLKGIYKSIDELNYLIEQIPDDYVALSKEIPKQLDEIERGHRTMLQIGYNFSEDNIDDEIANLKKECKNSLDNLANLDVDETKVASSKIEDSIDKMYAIMEKEIVSKRKVRQNMNLISGFIFHAKNQNRILLDELDRLSKNYNLEHDEIKNATKLSDEIKAVENTYNQDYQLVSDGKAVYSVIQKHQQDAKNKLSSIEKHQKDINDSVADLNNEEKVARDNLQKFDLQLLNIRRQIDNLNLPGLADGFLERYDYAYNKVSKLSSSINQVKISMDEINKQLVDIQDTMNQLLSDTDKIIDSAMLVERLMQYANRYRNSNDEIDSACAQAKRYFDNDYQYEKSLSTIATAIERVNPGAYKQIEEEYYNEKKN